MDIYHLHGELLSLASSWSNFVPRKRSLTKNVQTAEKTPQTPKVYIGARAQGSGSIGARARGLRHAWANRTSTLSLQTSLSPSGSAALGVRTADPRWVRSQLGKMTTTPASPGRAAKEGAFLPGSRRGESRSCSKPCGVGLQSNLDPPPRAA